MAEQLAVCLESGRDDAATALHGLLEGSRWTKGKHGEAKAAIDAFLAALRPVQESRAQRTVTPGNSPAIFPNGRFCSRHSSREIIRARNYSSS